MEMKYMEQKTKLEDDHKKYMSWLELFFYLDPLAKRKIFSMLGDGSRYNMSLLWKDMAYEVRALKSIPSVCEWESIKNLEDFETAGVLVTSGHIESVISVDLSGIDLSS